MNDFFINCEARFFCVLIIVFLYVFQVKSNHLQCKENKLIYIFSLAEISASVLGDLVTGDAVRNACFAACGFFCFPAACFCCECALKFTGSKAIILKRALCVSVCIVFGAVSYFSLRYGMNISCFVLTFIIMASVVSEQNNRIKTDSLTRLYNRYGMDAELREQLKQYEREHSDSFYIIACDLDNFKYINDTWGHPEGDRALVLIAQALARVGKRFSSGVFRIGGDEFVIITDTSEEGLAAEVTDAIKFELDNIDFRSDFDIEMSIGVALYDGAMPIDELLENADKELYEAKKNRSGV